MHSKQNVLIVVSHGGTIFGVGGSITPLHYSSRENIFTTGGCGGYVFVVGDGLSTRMVLHV